MTITGLRRWNYLQVSLLLLLAASLPAAELTLQFNPRWQGAALAVPSAPLTNAAGQTLRITRLAALVSGVTLWRSDGVQVRLEGQQGFLDAASGRLAVTFTAVPAGDYRGLEFQLGVPEAVNHGDPGRWPAGHPLNPLVNGLHWGWQGGYVFLALEGRWRETADGAAERGFSYHLATDARRMSLRFAANFRVEQATVVALALDLSRVLAAGKLVAGDGSETTHSAPDDALAARLATAVERAFFWLEATPGGSEVMAEAKVAAPKRVAVGTPRAFIVPAGFPQPALPADNPLTAEGVILGGRLFYDPRLSAYGEQSCASCHRPDRAFSDSVAFSRGALGRPGTRNAQPLVNLAWSPAYAWDGSQPRIRDQSLAAMTNPVEMAASLPAVVALLAEDGEVTADFRAAFGTPEVTAERIGLALEQYLLTQVSADSKLDRALRGEGELTAAEKRGFELFLTEYDPARGRRGADCFHCHGGPLFSDYAYKNNGLEAVASDGGRAKVTGRAWDAGKFKTPSLRNVALTAPYMHDGRFATLEDVVAHYDHGVKRSAGLDPNLAKHPDEGMALSAADQAALVAFLKTLTGRAVETSDDRRPEM